MTTKVLIISGGMDSYTLLHHTYDDRMPSDEFYALSFDYGQRHKRELVCAARACGLLGIPHNVVDLSGLTPLISSSALTGDIEVPEGHYADESMKLTVVPNRNMIMLSIAIGVAVSESAPDASHAEVYFGAHAGDHDIYPDCREEFTAAMRYVAELANYVPVEVIAPFQLLSKGEIAVIGRDLGLDYGETWTCYKGGKQACGKCGACVERQEAMMYAGIRDPLPYDSHSPEYMEWLAK